MKKGDCVLLRMQKMLCVGGTLDETVHKGTVLKYDKNRECIYFLLDSGKLTEVSLDATYECEIRSEKEQLNCTGRIKERYCGEEGKIIKFQIKNGFYKINIK